MNRQLKQPACRFRFRRGFPGGAVSGATDDIDRILPGYAPSILEAKLERIPMANVRGTRFLRPLKQALSPGASV